VPHGLVDAVPRAEYNASRPHQSLGMAFPADRLVPRPADERLSLRLPAAVTPAAPARHPARPSSAPVEPQRVQRRVSCRGALVVAGQRIHVGIVHAGRTLTVEAADSTWRIYDGDDGLIAEVARTTTNPSPGQDPQP
jgi:hypothetical protein